MSIKAMKQAIEALNEAVAFREGGRQKAIDAINALRTAIQQAESEPVAVAAPHIAMGFGRYEVGSGTYQGTPCIAFGKNGTGKVGDFVNMEPRQMSAEETVAVITFANVEGLDVLQEKVDEVRALHFPDTHPAPGVPDDVARDAERWRTFLATRPSNTHEGIIAAIDAASPAQKGEA